LSNQYFRIKGLCEFPEVKEVINKNINAVTIKVDAGPPTQTPPSRIIKIKGGNKKELKIPQKDAPISPSSVGANNKIAIDQGFLTLSFTIDGILASQFSPSGQKAENILNIRPVKEQAIIKRADQYIANKASSPVKNSVGCDVKMDWDSFIKSTDFTSRGGFGNGNYVDHIRTVKEIPVAIFLSFSPLNSCRR